MGQFSIFIMSQPLETSPEQSGHKIDFSLTKKIFGMTLPVAMGGHAETLVEMIQIFLIGMLGPAAISAVGIARAFTRILFTAMHSISRGAITMVAQAVGAESMEEASAAAKQAFSLLFVFSLVFGAGSYALSPFLIPALTSDPEVAALGTPFLQIFFIGVPFMTLNRAITSCLQGAGDTRTPFFLSIISSIIQISVSYLLIFGYWGLPELGVVGVAVAGLLGRGTVTLIGLGCLYSGRFALTLLPTTSYRFDWSLARRILKIGVPSGLQGILRNGSGLVYLKLIAMSAFSTTAVAAYTIGHQLERVLRRTGLAYGTVATALVGQHLGAKDPAGAERHGWTTLIISVITSLILSLPIAIFAGYFMALFTDSQAVIATGVIYLYAMVISEPGVCASNTIGGSLRGAGDTMPPMYYTLIAQWFVRLPIAYILAFTLGYDVNGIWAALIIYSIVQGTLNIRKFAKGDWKYKKI